MVKTVQFTTKCHSSETANITLVRLHHRTTFTAKSCQKS